MFMRWTDLAFLHWPVMPEELQRHLPRGLELDTYDGQAWLGVVPFRMEGVHPRWLPPIPTAATFPEINVRTYVRAAGRAGIWFFSLDASSWLAVRGARAGLNLPYYQAHMQVRNHDSMVEYESVRTHRGAPPAKFTAGYEPVEPAYHASSGSLEHWLTERYCLFGQSRSKRLYGMDVHHVAWPLQRARIAIENNTLAGSLGVRTTDSPPLMHFARRQDVVAWGPSRVPLSPRPAIC